MKKSLYPIKWLPLITALWSMFIGSATAQTANFEWVRQIGATGIEIPPSITLDRMGNIYSTGQFFGTVDFDPGQGTYNLTSERLGDVFILKLDPSGNFVWAKKFGGSGNDGGFDIAVDSIGNVYSTGIFNDSADFDPGPEQYKLTFEGNDDIFISKLDPLGNFLWAKRMGAITQEYALSIAVDKMGGVYTTGLFSTEVDFDPGPDTFWLKGTGSEILFISKLDSSGNFVWAKRLDGKNHSLEIGYSLEVDIYDNVYITGAFGGEIDFDSGAGIFKLRGYGRHDVFILKLNSAGKFMWARNFGGSASDIGHSIAIDNGGNVYTTGYFGGIADLVPGDGYKEYFSKGEFDTFLTKIDSSGTFVWSKQFGGSQFDIAYGVAVDYTGNIYMIGHFEGSADFDPNEGESILNSVDSSRDAFVLKLNGSGELLWAKKIGGKGFDIGYSIKVDKDDNIYSTGTFEGSVDFDPGLGISRLTTEYSNTYIHKMNQGVVGVLEDFNIQGCTVFPNPTNNTVTIEVPKKEDLQITYISVLNIDGMVLQQSLHAELNKIVIDLSSEPEGMYFIKLQIGTTVELHKITLIK